MPGIGAGVMVMVSVVIAPSMAPPVGAERLTVKLSVPVKLAVVLSGTVMVFAVASPSAQVNVPLVVV